MYVLLINHLLQRLFKKNLDANSYWISHFKWITQNLVYLLNNIQYGKVYMKQLLTDVHSITTQLENVTLLSKASLWVHSHVLCSHEHKLIFFSVYWQGHF
jgi:hypothetical protein